MIIIPVIDLMHGRAVQARLGHRETYLPIESPLCRNGDVSMLVHRFRDDFDCSLIYFADLDAILGRGSNTELLARTAEEHPQLDIWLDGGFRTPSDLSRIRTRLSARPVIGSESWLYTKALPDIEFILSVDRDAGGPRDPSGICGDPRRRPDDIILMNLTRVGGSQGPDLEMLRQWRSETPDVRLYAAGGVRNQFDLLQLQADGATGVLLASALHSGKLLPSDLACFS